MVCFVAAAKFRHSRFTLHSNCFFADQNKQSLIERLQIATRSAQRCAGALILCSLILFLSLSAFGSS